MSLLNQPLFALIVNRSADPAPPENCTSSTEYCPLSMSGLPFQPSATWIVALRGGKASLPSWSDNSKSSVSASKPRLSVKDKLIKTARNHLCDVLLFFCLFVVICTLKAGVR